MNNFDILFAKKLAGGGSRPPVLIEKNITANGTYTASDDSADGYSSVSVDVPNSYTAQDEGKVVDNGQLIAQTAMSTEITSNDTYDTTLYNSVTVNVPQGGSGESVTKKDVNFYDYDGTVVASYTASEFAELTAMPANPTHDGLTSQGWNWTLSDAKTYVATYGKLNVGQMYITSDGKTRLYIELTEGRLQPWLKLYLNANTELDIDWGDGSTHSTFTTTSADYVNDRHTYASAGRYVIAITVASGSFVLQSSSNSISTLLTNNNASTASPDRGYLNSIKKIEIGSSVESISSNAFQYCTSLLSVTISSSVTSIGDFAFSYCFSLPYITIPNTVTSISSSVFASCYSLSSITIPNTVTSISSSAFSSCYSLSSITILNTVTSIGSNAFHYCYSLATITIDKSSGSISGSPWGASTSSPTSTQIVWTG